MNVKPPGPFFVEPRAGPLEGCALNTSALSGPQAGSSFFGSSPGEPSFFGRWYPDPVEWILSLTPQVDDQPLRALASPPPEASIVELRADLFPGLDLRSAITACPLPVLVTHRSSAEGGRGPDSGGERKCLLEAARNAGAALIDLEDSRDRRFIDELGLAPEQCVLSWHDARGTPSDLETIAQRMLASRVRWVKVVPTARSVADLATLLALHRTFNELPPQRRRLMALAMGAPGIASRYLAPLLGPPIAYAAWCAGAEAAPGQLTAERTQAVISHLQGRPQRLYGVVGADVSTSLSPALHSAAYRAMGEPLLLLPISVPDAGELSQLFTVRGSTVFDAAGIEPWGWAVTSPYKRAAAAAADRHAPRVLRAGAANTLLLGQDFVTAENTDADGVVGSLTAAGLEIRGRTALVQGTGGAARGAAVGLHLAGAEVVLRGRSTDATRSKADAIGVEACAPDAFPEHATVLVNATPLGSRTGDPLPFTDREMAAAEAVVDMVYRDDGETELAVRVREAGGVLVDGREVLLHQGIAQIAAFTQKVPSKEAMRESLAFTHCSRRRVERGVPEHRD